MFFWNLYHEKNAQTIKRTNDIFTIEISHLEPPEKSSVSGWRMENIGTWENPGPPYVDFISKKSYHIIIYIYIYITMYKYIDVYYVYIGD